MICGKIAAGMPRIAAILMFCLVTVLAQASKSRPVATKIDEVGKSGHCDITARLDNFAIELQNYPDSKGTIIGYGPEIEGPDSVGHYLDLLKGYMVNARGIVDERLTMVQGGRNADLTQLKFELWLVPKDAAEPKPHKYETNIETMRGLLAEFKASDDFGVVYEPEMEGGIPDVTTAGFADVLNQQKKALGYIVVSSGEDLTPGAWRKIAQEQIENLKSLKVDENRLKIVFGGHQTETKTQLWVWPKDEAPPVADAGPEKPLERTMKIGEFADYNLSERSQKAIFSRLEELLRNDKNLRAFLVVTLDPQVDQEVYEGEPEPLDLTKVVEEWREELARTHKIGPDRFIVLFTPAESDCLSLWIVPNGLPLPDPKEPEIMDDAGVKP